MMVIAVLSKAKNPIVTLLNGYIGKLIKTIWKILKHQQ